MKGPLAAALALTLTHCGDDVGHVHLDGDAATTANETATGETGLDDAATAPRETSVDEATAEVAAEVEVTIGEETTPGDSAIAETTPDTPDVPPPPPGETCATARRITDVGPVEGTLVGAANDYDAGSPTCTGPQPGPDQVHVITLHARERLRVSLARSAELATAGLFLVPGGAAACDALPSTCVGMPIYTDTEEQHWVNAADHDVEVFIIVDTVPGASLGGYTLDLAIDTPVSGDTCTTAQVIEVAGTAGQSVALYDQTFATFAPDYVALQEGCLDARTPDRVYAVEVPSGQRLEATLGSKSGLTFALVNGPAAACEAVPLDCIGAATLDEEGPMTAYATNASASARTVFIVVRPLGTGEVYFDMTVALRPALPGESCDAPITVDTATALEFAYQATAGYVADVQPSHSCGWGLAFGADRVYRVTVPAHQRMSFSVVSIGSEFLPRIRVLPDGACGGSPVCLSAAKGIGGAADARWSNRTDAAVDVLVVVGGFAVSSGSGNFSIALGFDEPPDGDTCADAEALAPGDYPEQSTVDYTPDMVIGAHQQAVCYGRDRDRVYAISVPPMHRVAATATTKATGFTLEIVPGPAGNCSLDPAPCVEGNVVGGVAQLAWSNQSAEDVTAYLIAGGDADTAAGATFDLSVDVEPLPAGDLCATATPIEDAAHLTGQTTIGYTNDYAGGNYCGNSGGADRAYVVAVPNDMRLDVTVTPTTAWNPALELLADAAACLGVRRCITTRNVGGTGQAERAWAFNHSGEDRDIVVSVDSSDLSAGDFTLDVTLTAWPRPAGDTCANAEAIAPGGSVTDQTNDGYASDYIANSLACGGFGGAGGDRVYGTTIPAGMELAVTLTPTPSTAFLWMYLVPGDQAANCDASPLGCLAGDTTMQGPRTLTASNPGAEPMPLFIIVDGGWYDAIFPFALTTSLSALR